MQEARGPEGGQQYRTDARRPLREKEQQNNNEQQQ